MGKFTKGQSGNPRGRPKGSVAHKRIREAIMKNAPEIIETMIDKAKSGDTSAARILLDRVLAPMKAGDSLVNISFSGAMVEDARRVIKGVGAAELTVGQGQSLLTGLASLSRIIEIDELLERLEALEAKSD